MIKNPKITIVIGTLNRPKIVLRLLNEIVKYANFERVEVLVVDQSSKSNYQILQTKFPKNKNVLLFHFDKPNTCKYLNFGWKNARAPIVLYLDDDVSITKDTIGGHIDGYKEATTMGIAGRVINTSEEQTDNSTVGKILWYGAQFIKNFSSEKKVCVDFPYGCNMSFRKVVLERIGGFDENLLPPIYAYNEIDIGYRINKKWKNSIIFEPQALVYHLQSKQGGTRNNFAEKEIFNSTQFNYGYFLGKNYSWFQNILCFLRRLPYQLIRENSSIPHIIKGFNYGKQNKSA